MYLKDRERVIKKILGYSLHDYDSKKIYKTKHYFALLKKNKLSFAPVKTIMTDNKIKLSDADGTEAYLAAKKLGFLEIKGRVADTLKDQLRALFPTIKFPKNFKVLTLWDNNRIIKQVEKYAKLEGELRRNFIISGNKPLQGELGEWIFQKMFHATPLNINAVGADYEFKRGGKLFRVEVKTKRPSITNQSAVEVKCSKIIGTCKADYLFVVWFKDNYKIDHLSLISTNRILRKGGPLSSYEIDPKQFPNCIARSHSDLKNVSWHKYIKDIKFIKSWFSN